MLNVFIVEDEPIIGKHLKQSIEDNTTRTKLFSLGSELMNELTNGAKPDIILMDINLPDITGIELTKIITEKYPGIEIIIQTVNEENNIIMGAIEAGCSGYLLKTSTPDEIRMAMDVVKKGGSFLTGKIARKVMQKFRDIEEKIPGNRYNLTASEKNILNELVKGVSNKEIAAKLNITTHTVNMHLRGVYSKMQVNSRSEAVAKALKNN